MKLGRLACHCVYSDTGVTLLKQIDEIDAHLEAASYKKALRLVKDTVLKMKEEQKKHQEYVENHIRSQCEFHKVSSIMAPDAHGRNESVLRTSAWRAGDLDELRRPVPKKKKKKKKKKTTASSSAGQQQTFVKSKIGKPAKKIIKSVKKPSLPPPPSTPLKAKPIKRKTPKIVKIKRE